MRLFVALPVPDDLRTRIHEAAAPLRERDLPVRWVDPDLYHMTLKFLGDVDRERVPDLTAALDRVAGENASFEAEMAGFGAFPTIRRPRVLWVGVDPSPALRCLKQDVEWALTQLGFEREVRAFHPHLTLGRAREEGGAGAFRGLDELVGEMDMDGELPVSEVQLVRSRLSSSGPTHSVLHASPLAGSGDGS